MFKLYMDLSTSNFRFYHSKGIRTTGFQIQQAESYQLVTDFIYHENQIA